MRGDKARVLLIYCFSRRSLERSFMEIGVVKWFNNAKGFGFISAEGVDADIFAHYSVIEMDGYRSLKAGQKVQFEVIHGDKGSHATKIIPLVDNQE